MMVKEVGGRRVRKEEDLRHLISRNLGREILLEEDYLQH